MKRLIAFSSALVFAAAAPAATLMPPSLINPAGSTTGQVIQSSGPTTPPVWGGVSVTTATGTLPITHGGTGATSAAAALTALGAAPLASPTLTGTPTAPTPALGDIVPSQIATSQAIYNTMASPPGIGSTLPNAGTFTTLKSLNSKVIAYHGAAQSIPNGVFTAITNWTLTLNQGSNFNATTGVYIVPATGVYTVSGSASFAAATSAIGARYYFIPQINGTSVRYAATVQQVSGSSITMTMNGTMKFALVGGDTITVGILQTSGATQSLDNDSGGTWVSITQDP